MPRFALVLLLALTVVHCYGDQQVQMPETAELQTENGDLESQIKDLQRNVSDIWTYIHELRDAVSNHLNHLRQHQVVLETSMHKMEHLHESELQSSDHHHHSGEQQSHGGDDHHHSHSSEHHSHSGEQHSHGGDHSHSGEHHSHGGDHSHSGEHHSHGDHSHSGEHHSHGDEHGHYTHSHSHSSHDHSKEEGGHTHHGDDHHQHGQTDSHETEDFQQRTQQAVEPPPVSEPVVMPTIRREHYHSHHSHTSHSSRSDGMNLMNDNNLHRHHHHRHHHDSDKRNKTIELPKYSDYGLYDLAMCDVTPNRAIPEDKQQNVVGSVTLWQKKTGGPLNLHLQLQGFDVDGHHGHHQSVQQEENNDTPQIGHKHGFHVHALGDLSNGCQSTGPHFNPKGANHGGPNSLARHVGDLGSISCDDHGNTNIVFSDDIASLKGPYSIIGKSLVIHALEDDLGLGGNEESLKTGNAGTRIACCVIRRVDKIPMRQHRIIKQAVHHQNR